jgi:mRNA interferase MazF
MNRGTIVLTPFPFTDLGGSKVRPAIVVSSGKRKGDDIILAFISSVIDEKNIQETDLLIRENDSNFIETGLKVKSLIKLDKLATVHKRIILGELGNLDKDVLVNVDIRLKKVFDLE